MKKDHPVREKFVEHCRRCLQCRNVVEYEDPSLDALQFFCSEGRVLAADVQKTNELIRAVSGLEAQIQSVHTGDLADRRYAIVEKLFRKYGVDGKPSESPGHLETTLMLMANVRANYATNEDDSIASLFFDSLHAEDVIGQLAGWANIWRDSSFARLSVGAKLGAALMLTDAPDNVVSPWRAWSLCVPDGMIKFKGVETDYDGVPIGNINTQSIMRLWCYDTEPVAAIVKHSNEKVCFINTMDTINGKNESVWIDLARNFVKGACLSLAIDVEKHRNKTWGPSASKRAPGVVPGAGVDYVLGGTVGIDLRDEVRRICAGEKSERGGHSPTVQFLVRGHWRNQAVGVRHSEHKRIWIEPFWKGPEESRVLLRTHRIKIGDEE